MSDYTLTYGQHATREDGMCLMEAVAYLAGEPHTDAPACACPVLTTFATCINDAMGKGSDGDALRARYLHDLAPMLVGSRSTPEVEQARAYVLADHAVRVLTSFALESAGLHGEAKRLRTLGAVIDKPSAEAAAEAADKAAWAAVRFATRVAEDADARAVWAARAAAEAAAWAAGDADAIWAVWANEDADGAVWAAARAALVAALEAAP